MTPKDLLPHWTRWTDLDCKMAWDEISRLKEELAAKETELKDAEEAVVFWRDRAQEKLED